MSTENAEQAADSTQQTAHSSGEEQKAESGEKTEDGSGYSGGRVEPVDPATVPTIDDQSAYDAALPAVPEGAVLVSTSAPVQFTITNHAESTVELVDLAADFADDSNGVVGDDLEGGDLEAVELGEHQARMEADEEDAVVPTMRLLGSESGAEYGGDDDVGDGIDWAQPEEELDFGGVMIQLVDSALEEGEALDGQRVAQIFCRGDVEDERVAFLLLLLAQDKPVTGELVLAAARARGHEELVLQATLAKEELQAAGDVAVEQASAVGGFLPATESLGSQAYGSAGQGASS